MAATSLFLISPTADNGRTLRRLPDLIDKCRAYGIDIRVEVTGSLEHARSLAVDSAETSVVAVGGDGLVSCCADALVGTDKTLGIVPAGRGNDFARALGISRTNAVATIANGAACARRVDLGRVGNRHFTSVASFGFDSDVVERSNSLGLRGPLVYPIATVLALRKWRPAWFEVEIDGQRHDFVGYSVAVANGAYYGGGMKIAPHARLDDGLLDVIAVTGTSKLDFLRQAPRVFGGTHVKSARVLAWRASHVRVRADRDFIVFADGEPATVAPATISVSERCLQVYRPEP